jgi:hypothetical protein
MRQYHNFTVPTSQYTPKSSYKSYLIINFNQFSSIFSKILQMVSKKLLILSWPLLLFSLVVFLNGSSAVRFDADQWTAPFNNEPRLRALCADNNEFWIMRGSPVVGSFLNITNF